MRTVALKSFGRSDISATVTDKEPSGFGSD
jgi:hypothetical protein